MSVGENVRRLRQLTGETQEKLAEVAGVTRGSVSQWESGITEPRMGAIQLMVDHYHIRKANLIEDGGMDHVYRSVSGRLYEMRPSEELTEEELELVRLYRSANDQGKFSIMAVAQAQQGMDGQIQVDRRAM